MDESTTQDPMHEVKGIVYVFIFASDILYRGSTLFFFSMWDCMYCKQRIWEKKDNVEEQHRDS